MSIINEITHFLGNVGLLIVGLTPFIEESCGLFVLVPVEGFVVDGPVPVGFVPEVLLLPCDEDG